MLMLMLPADCIEAIRRSAFTDSVKITLELTRHRNEYPAQMEDKDYTAYLNNRLDILRTTFEACNTALNFKQQIPEGGQQ